MSFKIDLSNKMNNGEEHSSLKKDTKYAVLAGVFILLFGLGSFLIWAFTAPLSRGVVAEGKVVVSSKKKTVQHQYGGTIDDILVSEGDYVKEGQPLIKLDDSAVNARLTSVKLEYFANIAREARLITERLGGSTVVYPEELMNEALKDTEIQKIISTQSDLFDKRRESLRNQKKILAEQKAGLYEYISRLQELVEARNRQIVLLQNEIDSLKEITDEGYYPRNKMAELQRSMEGFYASRSEELASVERTKSSISELDLKIVQIEADFNREVEMELTEIQKKSSSLREEYYANQIVKERTVIKSPENGIILTMYVNTIGGVIRAGENILEIVPQDSDLEVEVRIHPQDIDTAQVGLDTEVRFVALDMRTTPLIFGKITMISPDVIIDRQTNHSYYLGYVEVSKDELKKIGDNKKLQPGMPAQVVIKAGERTLAQYIIKPFLDRFALAFKEE